MTGAMHVLIVDDNPDDRALAARELAGEFPDIHVIEVADATDFETALERGGFELVITEFRLGWSDGLSALRELKYRYPEIPVIMFTGAGSEEVAVEAMRVGLDDYVLKGREHVVGLPVAATSVLERAGERQARRRAEEALQQHRAMLLRSQRMAHVGSWVFDPVSRQIEWSEEMYRIYGLDPAAGSPSFSQNRALIHLDDRERFEAAAQLALTTTTPFQIELRILRPDGTIRHFVSWCEVELNQTDGSRRLVGTSQDITERKRAEEALRESEELFRTSFENAIIGIALVDTDGRFLRGNRTLCELLGYTKEELEQLTFTDVTHSEDKDIGASFMASALSGGVSSASYEKRYIHKDGHVIWVHASIALVRDATGEPEYFIGHVRDISEGKRAEEELRHSEGRIRELLGHLFRAQEEERARISGDIHDDSIQVMTAVGLRLEALRRRLTDPEALESLQLLGETVTSAIARLRHLMFELHPRVLDEDGLAPALRVYLDHMSEQVQIEYTLANRLEEEPALTVRTVLYRIAQEALVNIRKHANAARVEVVLEPREAGYAVRITDDGSGFDVGAAERTLPGHLGLAAMRERAEMVGGWWRIESTPGEGTTVEFWVPTEMG